MTDLIPGALILRFLLTPYDLTRVGVTAQDRRILLTRERIELFDTHQRNVAEAFLASCLQEVEIDFAGTEDDAAHRLGRQVVDLADYITKPTAGEILQGGNGKFMPQQTLRRHQDEGLSEMTQHLPAQHVKHLRRR